MPFSGPPRTPEPGPESVRHRETYLPPTPVESAEVQAYALAEAEAEKRTTRRAFLGALGGGAVVAAGTAFSLFGPFANGSRADPTAAPTASPRRSSTPSATPSASVTPSATPTPTPTETPTEAPTPEATVAPPVATDGAAMPLGTVTSAGITWKQVFAEDFDRDAALGRVLSTYPQMQAYSGQKDTSGYGLYAPNQVLSVSNSVLDFHLHSVGGQALVASVLPDGYEPHLHARVSIRYRADAINGYKFVGMLWPSSNLWSDGEIDWPEANLVDKPRPASEVVGVTDPATGSPQFSPETQYFAPTDQSDWHVATTEWIAGQVLFYWDGVLLATTSEGVPTKPMRVTLQAETWLYAGPVPSGADGHVQIDWVAIWEQA